MLGLPVVTGRAGFIPTTLLFLASWIYMLATGLLFLEVNLWFKEEVSIISMVGRTLGKWGQAFAWALYLFLFGALMVAYLSGGGEMLVDFSREQGLALSSPMGGFIFMAITGVLIFLGTSVVDRFNRVLMIGLVVAYIFLIGAGSSDVNTENLSHRNWNVSLFMVPIMVISFGYHNLIPSLTTYLKQDVKALRRTIIIGSLIPLIIYLAWEWVILGIVPFHHGHSVAGPEEEFITRILREASGSSWVIKSMDFFAFFAVATSFLSVALAFLDFLADGLGIKKTLMGRSALSLMVVLPPYLLGLLYPNIFVSAISYAGAFGAVVLFGILPTTMAYIGRYRLKIEGKQILPGGKFSLGAIFLFSLITIAIQCYKMAAPG